MLKNVVKSLLHLILTNLSRFQRLLEDERNVVEGWLWCQWIERDETFLTMGSARCSNIQKKFSEVQRHSEKEQIAL
jgi:hypothetical protein